MTSELPPEAHFYRESMTPESPRPLHPAEPSAFPVLRNQMDPVFNDTTTYDIPVDPSATIDATAAPVQIDSQLLLQAIGNSRPDPQPSSNTHPIKSNDDGADTVLTGTNENDIRPADDVAHTSNVQVSDLQRTLDSLANVARAGNEVAGSEAVVPNGEGLVDDGHSKIPETSATEAKDHLALRNEEGAQPSVSSENQYQSLFDALSKSTSSAAVDSNVSGSAPVTAREGSAAPRQSSENPLPLAAGLPPRPPPQENPSTHADFSNHSSSGPHSSHPLSPHNVNTTSLQSKEPTYRPDANSALTSSLSPSQAIPRAANGLPPPPIATFQQTPADATRTQTPQSQVVQSSNLSTSESPRRRHGSQISEDPEQPWGPEIQKKYDDFLQAERAYVTEGVWDQFPPGSRLFIGTFFHSSSRCSIC